MMTCFYGEPETSKRHTTRKFFQQLQPDSLIPWLVIGYFNDIFYQHAKMGGRSRYERLMHDYRMAVEKNNLIDLGHLRDFLTGNNKHVGATFTKECLDHVFANLEWQVFYNNTQVESPTVRNSDHRHYSALATNTLTKMLQYL